MPLIYHYTLFRVNILTICLYFAGNILLIYLLQVFYRLYTDCSTWIVPRWVISFGKNTSNASSDGLPSEYHNAQWVERESVTSVSNLPVCSFYSSRISRFPYILSSAGGRGRGGCAIWNAIPKMNCLPPDVNYVKGISLKSLRVESCPAKIPLTLWSRWYIPRQAWWITFWNFDKAYFVVF